VGEGKTYLEGLSLCLSKPLFLPLSSGKDGSTAGSVISILDLFFHMPPEAISFPCSALGEGCRRAPTPTAEPW